MNTFFVVLIAIAMVATLGALLFGVVTMARGWSITRTVDGAIVRSTNDANPGDTLITRVADGTITSTVEK